MAAPAPKADPVARAWTTQALVVAAALAVGLLLQRGLAARLEAIRVLSQTDMLAARAELAFVLQVVAVAVFGSTGMLGVALIAASWRAIRLEHFPPPGAWSWRSARVVTGPRARRLALVSLALAAALVLCSAAGGALTWYMAAVLLACKAT